MPATDQQSLVTAANPLQSIICDTAFQVMIALLAQIAGPPYSTMTSNQLVALADKYQVICGADLQRQVIIALLAQIVNGPGAFIIGPNKVASGNYVAGAFMAFSTNLGVYLVTPGATENAFPSGTFQVTIGATTFSILKNTPQLIFSASIATPVTFSLGASNGPVTATVQLVTA